MIYLLLALAALGHGIFWAAIVNRLHGLGINRRWVDAATGACGLALGTVPLAIAAVFWVSLHGAAEWPARVALAVAWGYVNFSAAVCVFSAIHRLCLALHPERRGSLASNHTTRVDMGKYSRDQLIAPGVPRLLGHLPGNQVLDLKIHEKRLDLPRMPAGSELRVVHITDLHMSGRIGKGYFEAMVAAVNDLKPDLIAITGDLVEREKCLAWVADTLGQLRAAAGVYYVLGNHDVRVDCNRLRAELADLGLIHVGGTWRQVTIRDTPVVLAGNELPWFGPAPEVSKLPERAASDLPLRILLAHAPDQFTWARKHDFDLMLAGHNHGGQVRLPLLGAILAPSLSGTRYACGVFRRDNTILHVSRGTGSLTPFRWNCPPEIALLVLRTK